LTHEPPNPAAIAADFFALAENQPEKYPFPPPLPKKNKKLRYRR